MDHIYSITKLNKLVCDMAGLPPDDRPFLPRDNSSEEAFTVKENEIIQQTPKIKRLYEMDYKNLSAHF